jgi:hypothetical protein
MLTRTAIAFSSLAFLVAAAPAPDPILSRIIADARAVPPASIAYERQSHTISQEKGGERGSSNRVDRWDGRSFTLVSVDGKPPTAKEAEAFRKAAASRPIPGYHRLADLFAKGAVRLDDPQGRIVYRIAGLPKGTMTIGKDVSANVVGEFFVDNSGPQPYVTRARMVLAKPVSFFMVAKLDSLEVTNEYKLDAKGRPYLARVVQAMSGAQFGKQGSTRSEITYTLLR